MTKIIFDSSALLALINQEKGADIVEKYLSHSIMSCINTSETLSILLQTGIPSESAENIINELIHTIIPFDHEQALLTAKLRISTKAYGLSLGDRACLSLAQIEKAPVLTADKIWAKLNQAVKIILIR